MNQPNKSHFMELWNRGNFHLAENVSIKYLLVWAKGVVKILSGTNHHQKQTPEKNHPALTISAKTSAPFAPSAL